MTGHSSIHPPFPTLTHSLIYTAYVYQEDLFFPTLTVREHLTFHAMVRVNKSVPVEDRLKRVEQVLDSVNLRKCADSLIGGPNAMIRGMVSHLLLISSVVAL